MEPITRKELFMAKAAGENVNVPEPITREEKYLKHMADNSVSKYFGESTEVLFDQRVEFGEDGGIAVANHFGLEAGESYKVLFNGAIFDCIAEVYEESGETIGVQIASPNELNYMFNIIDVRPEIVEAAGLPGNAMITTSLVNMSFPVKIEKPVVHTIDPKFLPEGVGGGGCVTLYATSDSWCDAGLYLYHSADYSEDSKVTKDELIGYAMKAKPIVVFVWDTEDEIIRYEYVSSVGEDRDGAGNSYASAVNHDWWFATKEFVEGYPAE